jgi:tRNA-splicing ligase RtcB
MQWATDFALASRKQMIERLLVELHHLIVTQRLDVEVPEPQPMINIHHNFAALEVHGGQQVMVHRKGATSAFAGQLGIIPGSMGARSYIVHGLGNPESLLSCSHGAGRRMSRNVARKTIDTNAFSASLAASGSFSKASQGYLDEAPGAYKDIETVIARQTDLIEIVHTLSPLITVKGDSRARED